jgi:uncharacterized OB-fold protein
MWEYVVILMILAVVGYWIFFPLLRPIGIGSFSTQRREEKGKALLQRKEEVYAAIKEMDFDYGMGKISEDDYHELRSQYKVNALEIMKQLDTQDGGDDIDAAIEREVQSIRDKEKPVIERKDEKKSLGQINFCPQCGRKIAQGDNFCPGCGRSTARAN